MFENQIEEALTRAQEGDNLALTELATLLTEQILYVPVRSFGSPRSDDGSKIRIRVSRFRTGGRFLVPVFTSEEFFLSWSKGNHQCLPITGSDLGLTLPGDYGLSVNPGRENGVELSADLVAMLTDSSPIRQLEKAELESSPSVFEDLKQLLGRYPTIEEGYYQESSSGQIQAVLGLLAGELDPETRFELIDGIAEISRRHFETAGAIEVYDDLSVVNSNSWQLFSALTPFYVRRELLIEKSVTKSSKLGSANALDEQPNPIDSHPK